MKYLNLDAFVCEDAKVKILGKEYSIPGEVSVDEIFGLEMAFQKAQEEPEKMEVWDEWLNELYELFCRKNEMPPFKKFKRMFSLRQLGALHGFVVSALNDSGSSLTEEQKENQKKTALAALEEPKEEQTSL